MLYIFTLLVDTGAMVITLWLAFYLLGRGFPSQIALRAVVVLLALSLFFASAFLRVQQIGGTTALRADLLVIALATWYSLTYQLLPVHSKKRLRWLKIAIYILGSVTIVILSTTDAFPAEKESLLLVGRMGVSAPYIIYGLFQVLSCGGILYNLLTDNKIGLKPQGRYLLLASFFPIIASGYGILASAITPPMPRLVQDLLILSGVFLLGMSIARYQVLVERRTTLQDLPVSGLVLLGLSGIYALLAWRQGLPLITIAAVTMLAILTHSIYDLGREFLERLRIRNESAFRRQLHQLESEVSSEESLQQRLQEGLDLLCHTLRSSGGIIASRRSEHFVVIASRRAMSLGSQFTASYLECEDICQPDNNRVPDIAWIAPVFEGDTQVAALGIGYPKNKLHYSADDLDLLGEVAERVGTIISLSNAQPAKAERLQQTIAEIYSDASALRLRTNEMMATMATSPGPELVKMVEESLRSLTDYIELGQLPLASCLDLQGESHIERGKNLQQIIMNGIDALRPAGPRPSEPLPRVWYNYAILYDAYVECVPNREIMARLYISEGTFNRTRRNALRGLARLLLEKEKWALTAHKQGDRR